MQKKKKKKNKSQTSFDVVLLCPIYGTLKLDFTQDLQIQT